MDPVYEKYSPTCQSCAIENICRGAIIGACWGAYLPNPYKSMRETQTPNDLFLDTSKVTVKEAVAVRIKNVGASSITLALFLGAFTSVVCFSERITNLRYNHPINISIGGAFAGYLLNFRSSVSTRNKVLTTLGTGFFSGALAILSYPDSVQERRK